MTEKDRKNSISCHGISAPKNEPIPVYIFSQSHTDVKISDNQSSILDDLDDEIREVSEMYDRRLRKEINQCEKSMEESDT